MTDRVPGAPGQYRATVSSEEFSKLQNGEAFTITMLRDDVPLTEGTPYSKAAVLPDSVANKICPDIQDPSPADAFAGLLPIRGGTMTGALTLPYFLVNRENNRTVMQILLNGALTGAIQQSTDANQLRFCVNGVGNTTYSEVYNLPVPDASITADKKYIILTNKTVTDYVVAQGTSGGWHYRKWNSGRAECWYSAVITDATAETGITMTYGFTRWLNYPFTFKATPTVNVNVRHDTSGGIIRRVNSSTTQVGISWDARSQVNSNELFVYACGSV